MTKSEIIRRYGIEEYERRKEHNRQWRKEHKEELKQYDRLYNEAHKEERKQYKKQYRQEHKEELKQYDKQYNDENKQPCVYAYTDLDGYLVYIGSTSNLKKRERCRRTCKGHSDRFKEIYQASPDQYICHVLQYTDTIEEARELEKRFIGALNPRYNILCRTV